MKWIELKEGCEMPDYDEYVLWETEEANFFVEAIDKDDSDWWNGTPMDGGRNWRPKCVRWARIPRHEDEFNQEELWNEIAHEMDREGIPVGEIESFMIYWKGKYTLSRK